MGYTAKPAIYGALAARSARVPRIVPMLTGLGYAFLDGGGVKRLAVRKATLALYKRAFRASHAAIFHNRDDLAVIRAHRVLPERLPVHVVSGSGIDLAHYTPVAFPPTGDGLTFLMIARLVRYKGVEEYCEAARAVKTAHPRTRFVLVGPEEGGPAGFSASALAAWSDCVEYLGPSDDVREHIARSHVYVLPSYGEGMPRTVLEAMALGRPIITTDARGCRETVDERVNGCLVPTGDSRALAEAMLSFLRRPDEIPAMGRASRQKAERRFDVRMVNREMIDILVGSASVVTGGIERLSA
jgi:glycosyltransferase involved in cell wall biosynthesis